MKRLFSSVLAVTIFIMTVPSVSVFAALGGSNYAFVFDNALFSSQSITLIGSSAIQGNAATNSAVVSLEGTSSINGALYIGPDESLEFGSNKVTGGVFNLQQQKIFNMPSFRGAPSNLANKGALEIAWNPPPQPITADGAYDSISVVSNQTLQINVGTGVREIYVDQFTLNGHIEVIGTGTLYLYVNTLSTSSTNNINISGAAQVYILIYGTTNGFFGNSQINANIFVPNSAFNLGGSAKLKGNVICGGSQVEVSGSATIEGSLYVPNAAFTLSSSTPLVGAVISNSYSSGGNSHINYSAFNIANAFIPTDLISANWEPILTEPEPTPAPTSTPTPTPGLTPTNAPEPTSTPTPQVSPQPTPTPVFGAVSAANISEGAYVQFGRYNGAPILWRVINKDPSKGLMLFSERIISLKSFDAFGDTVDGRGGVARGYFGSNYWEKSNIREWLNSEDTLVSYSQQAPHSSNVFQGYNGYANERGFLNYFTQEERNIIIPVTHRSIISEVDAQVRDGGNTRHGYDHRVPYAIANYDDAYYKNVTDKVYLLDVKELKEYVYDRGFEHTKKPTELAVNASDYRPGSFNANNYWHYWLRTPDAGSSYNVRYVYRDTYVGYVYGASNGTMGVAPALNISLGSMTTGGNGQIETPYLFGGQSEPLPTPAATLTPTPTPTHIPTPTPIAVDTTLSMQTQAIVLSIRALNILNGAGTTYRNSNHSNENAWSKKIEAYLENNVPGSNRFGFMNPNGINNPPYNGKAIINWDDMNLSSDFHNPLVFITNNSRYEYETFNSSDAHFGRLKGALIFYKASNEENTISYYYINENGTLSGKGGLVIDTQLSHAGTTYNFRELDVADFRKKGGNWTNVDGGFSSSWGLLFIENQREEYIMTLKSTLGEGTSGGYGILFETVLDEDNNDTGYVLQLDRGLGRGSVIIRPRTNGSEGNRVSGFVFDHANSFIPDKNTDVGSNWWASEKEIKLQIARVENSHTEKRLSVWINDQMLFNNFIFQSDVNAENNFTGFRSWMINTVYHELEIE